jgi:hypothetical protein
MPRVHIDWRVLFIEPVYKEKKWQRVAWLAVSYLMNRWGIGSPRLVRYFLKPKENIHHWLLKHTHRFSFETIVVGPTILGRAVKDEIDYCGIWVSQTKSYADWEAYQRDARADNSLVEFIAPFDRNVPSSSAITIKKWRGWGTEPGR